MNKPQVCRQMQQPPGASQRLRTTIGEGPRNRHPQTGGGVLDLCPQLSPLSPRLMTDNQLPHADLSCSAGPGSAPGSETAAVRLAPLLLAQPSPGCILQQTDRPLEGILAPPAGCQCPGTWMITKLMLIAGCNVHPSPQAGQKGVVHPYTLTRTVRGREGVENGQRRRQRRRCLTGNQNGRSDRCVPDDILQSEALTCLFHRLVVGPFQIIKF